MIFVNELTVHPGPNLSLEEGSTSARRLIFVRQRRKYRMLTMHCGMKKRRANSRMLDGASARGFASPRCGSVKKTRYSS